MTSIQYTTDVLPSTDAIIELYESSGIKRPVDDPGRIAKMYDNSNLVICAWSSARLIGVARSVTDFCYACYLSDLAVDPGYQRRGVGRKLIGLTRLEIGMETSLILLSAPNAMEYYPLQGFEKILNGYIIKRLR